MILSGLAAAPRPEDRSLVEAFLGEKPGFLAAALGQIKTLLILSTVVTIAMGAVVIVTSSRAQRRNPRRRRRNPSERGTFEYTIHQNLRDGSHWKSDRLQATDVRHIRQAIVAGFSGGEARWAEDSAGNVIYGIDPKGRSFT